MGWWHFLFKRFLSAACRKSYDGYMLQNRLHFKIHAALQEIKHIQKQNKAESTRDRLAKCPEFDTGSVGELAADGASLSGSESSFETAPEDSSDEELCKGPGVAAATNATPVLSTGRGLDNIRRETTV